MTEEHRIAVGSNSSLGADEVARRQFPTVRKGLDSAAVRAFLEAVAGELRSGAHREDDLRRRLESAERRAAAPELDEGTLAAALGVETARVLQSAHEAARQIVERAEARALELESQAARALEERISEGEDGARRLREEARAAGSAMLDTARVDAERLVEATKSECRAMVAEARQVRARVLRDLTERRRVLRVQVEQLLAGRGSLLSAVDSVRTAVDDLTTRLTRAEVEAREAADAAAPDADEVDAAFSLDTESLRVAGIAPVRAPRAGAGEEEPVADDAGGPAPEGSPASAPGRVFDADAPEDNLREPDSSDFEGVTVLGVVPAPPAPPGGAGAADQAEEVGAGDDEVGEEGGGPTDASRAAVDELFAKIRVSCAEQVARAREILDAGEDQAGHPAGRPEPYRRSGGLDEGEEATAAHVAVPEGGEGVAELAAAANAGGGEHASAVARGPVVHAATAAEVAAAAFEEPASAAESGAGAPEDPPPAAPAVAAAEEQPAAGAVPEPEEPAVADGAAAPEEPAGTGKPAPASVVGAGQEADAGPHAEAFAERDHLLAPVVTRLSRSLKRALQDDQNDLLDRLRHVPAGASLDEVLPQRQQEDRYASAAAPSIEAARKAGTTFAGAATGADAGRAQRTDGGEDARSAARRLAEQLVSALRLRTEGCLAAAGAGAGSDVVGVAYREWKGDRIAEIAGDHATRAFAGAQLEALVAAGDDAPLVVWAVDDGAGSCPDCDDNVLAGPQAPGEAFPTGQQHPPVHPGCRCLLVTVRS